MIVSDGVLYKKQGNNLVESYDNKTWQETMEFKFDYINREWYLFDYMPDVNNILNDIKVGEEVYSLLHEKEVQVLEIGENNIIQVMYDNEERFIPLQMIETARKRALN